MLPDKSPEPTAVAAAVATIHAMNRRWLAAFYVRLSESSVIAFDPRLCYNASTRERSVLYMVKVALFVRLEAKPGKEADVENFLRGGLPLVQEEPDTIAWFGIRLGPTSFGIFDAFPGEAGRQAHLTGRVAAALMAKASELFAQPPVIEKVDILAAKLPE
jgi:quinol monooxygenase YgiN